MTKKKIAKIFATTVFLLANLMMYTSSTANAWRAVSTRTIHGHVLAARADLPQSTDSQGCGAWRAQATYPGTRANNELTVAWSFRQIGIGTISSSGPSIGMTSGNRAGSFTARSATANANGRVCVSVLTFWVGMDVTASFVRGNTWYSWSTRI